MSIRKVIVLFISQEEYHDVLNVDSVCSNLIDLIQLCFFPNIFIRNYCIGNAVNVFKGMLNNPIFCSVLLVTSVLQVLIVQYGGQGFSVVQGGLNGEMWIISLVLGFFTLPFQQVINLVFRLGLNAKSWRQKRRLKKDASLRARHQNNVQGHLHQE